jgi:DNA-binding NarL/FixJ family response regulator
MSGVSVRIIAYQPGSHISLDYSSALLAAGKTDREIADALFLRVRTVGNHVKHILNKTSIANRTEAAVQAARMGLV